MKNRLHRLRLLLDIRHVSRFATSQDPNIEKLSTHFIAAPALLAFLSFDIAWIVSALGSQLLVATVWWLLIILGVYAAAVSILHCVLINAKCIAAARR